MSHRSTGTCLVLFALPRVRIVVNRRIEFQRTPHSNININLFANQYHAQSGEYRFCILYVEANNQCNSIKYWLEL